MRLEWPNSIFADVVISEGYSTTSSRGGEAAVMRRETATKLRRLLNNQKKLVVIKWGHSSTDLLEGEGDR